MNRPLRLGSRFFKAHGHGNDYLVFQEGDAWTVSPGSVQAVCHPHRGVGADGIVALLSHSGPDGEPGPGGKRGPGEGLGSREGLGPSDVSLKMFNPDGSEFERSGNGLRILGAYLFVTGRVPLNRQFSVSVGGGIVGMEILGVGVGGTLDVRVDMGAARLGIEAVAGNPGAFGPGQTLEAPGGLPLKTHLVSIGNPHCVVFRPELLEEELLQLGPFLSSNPAFSAGTNVQLVRVLGNREVRILIWERGVGRTASSGTSACAVAAAGVRAGLLEPGAIRVAMEGGDFTVTVSEELDVRLEGPVQPLYDGELRKEMLTGLGGFE